PVIIEPSTGSATTTSVDTTAHREVMSIEQFVMQELTHGGDIDDRVRLALSGRTMKMDLIKALSLKHLDEALFPRIRPNRQRFATRNGVLDVGRDTFTPYPIPEAERYHCGDAYRYLDVDTDYVPVPAWARMDNDGDDGNSCFTLQAVVWKAAALQDENTARAEYKLDCVFNADQSTLPFLFIRDDLTLILETYVGDLLLHAHGAFFGELAAKGGRVDPVHVRETAAADEREMREMCRGRDGGGRDPDSRLLYFLTQCTSGDAVVRALPLYLRHDGAIPRVLPRVTLDGVGHDANGGHLRQLHCKELSRLLQEAGHAIVYCNYVVGEATYDQRDDTGRFGIGHRHLHAGDTPSTCREAETQLARQIRAYMSILKDVEPPLFERSDIRRLYAQMPDVRKVYTDQHLAEDVICWLLGVGFGRLYFRKLHVGDTNDTPEVPAGGRAGGEDWQMVVFFHGPGGTGKSLIIRVAVYPFLISDYLVLESNSEPMFALQNLPGRACWILPELKRNFSMPEGTFNSLIANEPMSWKGKFHGADNMTPNMHGVLAGNDPLPYTDDSRSTSRRTAIVVMPHEIPLAAQDPLLFKRITTTTQLTAFLQCVTRLYLTLSRACPNFWGSCPKYFIEQQELHQADSNPVISFMRECDDVAVGHIDLLRAHYYVPVRDFKTRLNAYCKEDLNMQHPPKWTVENLHTPLRRLGLDISDGRRRKDWHGRSVHTVWVMGVDIEGLRGMQVRQGQGTLLTPPPSQGERFAAEVGGGNRPPFPPMECEWALDEYTSSGKNVAGLVEIVADNGLRVVKFKSEVTFNTRTRVLGIMG
ncbi:MAG: hypothetical protein DRO14_06335, partial [Thermoprotei archaeon]